MYTFNPPPGWPAPPEPGWRPPLGWQPDPSWPPAPPGWSFWLNRQDARGLGPRGAYGALGRGRLAAGAAAAGAIVIVGLVLMANDDSPAQSAEVPGSTTTVTVTAKAQAGSRVTMTAPPRTLPRATVRVTVTAPRVTVTSTRPAPIVGPTEQPSQEDEPYYSSCAAARRAGDTPLYRGDPGYGSHLDRDDDGVACES